MSTSIATILSRPFEKLRRGDSFLTPGRTVTEADVVSFTTLTGDFSPLHVDAMWAADSPFGERIAPGMLTLSYALGLVRFDPEWTVAFMGITDVVFTRPVKIGDTISVSGRITALAADELGDLHTVTLTLLTANQHKKTVCRARVQAKWSGSRSGHRPTGES